MAEDITVLKLPPELSDGQHTIYVRPENLDHDLIKDNLKMLPEGESVTIEKTVIDREEFESLEPI